MDLQVVSPERQFVDGADPSLPEPLCRVTQLRSLKIVPLFRCWGGCLHQLLRVLCGTECEQDFAVLLELCLYPRQHNAWSELARYFEQHAPDYVWTPEVHTWFAQRAGDMLSYDRTLQIYTPAPQFRRP